MDIDKVQLTSEDFSDLEDLIDGLGSTPSSESTARISSSQKMRYFAEVSVIKKKWGDLEEMRKHLGISQRKMCQLLMVDPSAWTRWTKYEKEAPPHIYRALSWFLLLNEKDPTSSPYVWLQSVARPSIPKTELQTIENEIQKKILKEAHTQMLRNDARLKWVLFINISLLLMLFCYVLILKH